MASLGATPTRSGGPHQHACAIYMPMPPCPMNVGLDRTRMRAARFDGYFIRHVLGSTCWYHLTLSRAMSRVPSAVPSMTMACAYARQEPYRAYDRAGAGHAVDSPGRMPYSADAQGGFGGRPRPIPFSAVCQADFGGRGRVAWLTRPGQQAAVCPPPILEIESGGYRKKFCDGPMFE
jgi:hypothetical protein